MEFPVARLNIVRDMFLFSYFTGLAFIDAKELKRTEIYEVVLVHDVAAGEQYSNRCGNRYGRRNVFNVKQK